MGQTMPNGYNRIRVFNPPKTKGEYKDMTIEELQQTYDEVQAQCKVLAKEYAEDPEYSKLIALRDKFDNAVQLRCRIEHLTLRELCKERVNAHELEA